MIDGPFDAQRQQDEQDDREPEFVAGGRAGLGGAGRRGPRMRLTLRRRRAPRCRPPSRARSSNSSTSKSATAKRVGAFGLIGAADGAPDARHADGVARGVVGEPGCDGREDRGDGVDAGQLGPGVRDADRLARRPERARRPTRPAARPTGSSRRPGWPDRPACRAGRLRSGPVEPPSSSPVRFAQEDRECDLQRQVRLARLEREDCRRQAGPRTRVEQGSAGRTWDDRPCPVRERELGRRRDVGRRQVHVAEDRLGRIERADPRVGQRPGDGPERARRRRPDGQDRRPRQGRRERALEDDQVPRAAVRCAPWPDRTPSSVTPNSSTFGR